MTEQTLIAWLVMLDFQWSCEAKCAVPERVIEALIGRGWLTGDDDPNWEGAHEGTITPEGNTIVDLHGPDFGIETIPSEAEEDR